MLVCGRPGAALVWPSPLSCVCELGLSWELPPGQWPSQKGRVCLAHGPRLLPGANRGHGLGCRGTGAHLGGNVQKQSPGFGAALGLVGTALRHLGPSPAALSLAWGVGGGLCLQGPGVCPALVLTAGVCFPAKKRGWQPRACVGVTRTVHQSQLSGRAPPRPPGCWNIAVQAPSGLPIPSLGRRLPAAQAHRLWPMKPHTSFSIC